MVRRIAAIALVLGGCGPFGPRTDSCSTAGGGTITLLEVGPGSPTDNNGPFVSWQDGDTVPLVRGGQGATMVVARLRITGIGALDCLGQKTSASDGMGTLVASVGQPLHTYAESLNPSSDTRVTKSIYLPGAYPGAGSTVKVDAAAGGLTVERTLVLEIP